MSVEDKIGILAYGSLINDPGLEISSVIERKIECNTPFNIEYARMSKSRGFAPTLIPVEKGGAMVNAVILVLEKKITLDEATLDLDKSNYRRIEAGKTNLSLLLLNRIAKTLGVDVAELLPK